MPPSFDQALKDAIDDAVRPVEHGRPLAHHETQVIGDAGQRPEKGGPERGEPERVQCAPDGGREARHDEIHRDVRGQRHGERRPGIVRGDGGVIAIDQFSNIGISFNTEGMYRAYITSDGKPVVEIYKN